MNNQMSPEIQGYCPVAYFAVGEPLKGDAEHAVVHHGRLYHFVNADAKAEFEKNPERYLPAYDGRCAFGMSIEKDFEPCPCNFKIIDGRLHLFLKNDDTDALELWNNGDEAKCIANANKHWSSQKSA